MSSKVARGETADQNLRPAWHRALSALVEATGARALIDRMIGLELIQWLRVFQQQEIQSWLDELPAEDFDVLKISGDEWRDARPWKMHRTANFPAFDVCDQTLEERFDLIIADQVFEHLNRPSRAAGNVLSMLRPGGRFLISTPFLVWVHQFPIDCTRWIEDGLRHFLGEAGFPLECIKTRSWGNRACVKENFSFWMGYRSRFHSLRNEPNFPITVWAMATRDSPSPLTTENSR